MANKIQIRRDTTANWTASNPILSQGELGLDTTLNKMKIGNGTSNWSALSFYFGDPTSLINGLHTVSLGSDGIVTLPADSLIVSETSSIMSVGAGLADLETAYTDLMLMLDDVFTQISSESGYPWGITLPLSVPLTYNQLINLSPNTFTGQANATTVAHNANTAYNVWRDAAAATNILVNVSNKSWTFGNDGGITFPTLSVDIHNGGVQTAQVLKFNDTNKQVIITGPTPAAGNSAERIIIQGQRATGNGEGGDVYLWGGDSDVNGGDIKIYAGDGEASPSNGGYVNIDGGNGYAYGGGVSITAGSASEHGGNINISAGYAYGQGGTPGNIQLNTYAQSNNANLAWTFTNDGKLQLPAGGDVVNSDGNSVLTGLYKFSGNTIGTKANPDTLNGWGGYDMYLDPGAESAAYIYIPGNVNQTEGNSLQILNKGAATSIVQVVGWGGVQLVTNTGLDENVFEFNDNGTISFPNNKLKTPSSLVVETTSGIPTSVTKTSSNQGWAAGNGLGTDLPTTGGSGTGLTVDVVDTGSAYAGITIHTPGSGYQDGETLTVTNQGMSDTFTVTVPVNNWTFGTNGRTTLPNGGVPSHSYGAAGDKEGMVVFSDNYIYYCKQDYVGNSVNVTTLASSGSTVYVSSTDYAGDLVADFTANSTGWTYAGVSIISVAVDNTFGPGYALEAATSFGAINSYDYALVSPNALPDIWKRVSWSVDTW